MIKFILTVIGKYFINETHSIDKRFIGANDFDLENLEEGQYKVMCNGKICYLLISGKSNSVFNKQYVVVEKDHPAVKK